MKDTSLNIFVKIYLSWLIFVFFYTEALSFLHLVSRQSVISGNLIFLFLFFYYHRKEFIGVFKKEFIKAKIFSLRNKFNLVICFILILVFIQGFFSAPNTTDAMTYHITRTMYWIQEKTMSQDFLRSSHDFNPRFGENILLNIYLFLNNDKLLFLSEWLAFAVAIYLSGVLAYKLGASQRAINFVRIFVATIPIALLQSSSTQVDLVTNVLVLFGLYFVLDLIEKPSIKNSLMLAILTGLGMQVKSPFIFYILIPLGVLGLFKVARLRKEASIFLIIFLVSLLMQLSYWSQNTRLYGNFLGQSLSGKENNYVNERFDLPALISNVVRNFFNQLPIPLFAKNTEKILDQTLSLMGSGIKDPKTTYPGHEFHVLSVVYPQEDIVSSPVQLLLIILSLALVFKNGKRIKNVNIVRAILILVFISFVIFVYILKYEPYHPRLQIPYFTIGTIASVLILVSYRWGGRFLTLLLIPAVILGFSLILLNILRPYISYSSFYNQIRGFAPQNSAIPEAFYVKPRIMQYFNSRPYLYGPYNQVTDVIASSPGFKYIVLHLFDDEYEYPLWALLKDKKVDFYIQQNKFVDDPIPKDALILTTSEKPVNIYGYETKCYKTEIDYGYACLSSKK